MQSDIRITDDGSHTLFNLEVREHYHSTHGAIGESKHIFIEPALLPKLHLKDLNILEIGTGTGLNVLLTYQVMERRDIKLYYEGVELYPIDSERIKLLNYPEITSINRDIFYSIHQSQDRIVEISDGFRYINRIEDLVKIHFDDSCFDIVYFDAFSPDSQPELWTVDIFQKIFKSMKVDGILTTYSCKGTVKRAMKEVGFRIEKLPGPPGKREFLRAFK